MRSSMAIATTALLLLLSPLPVRAQTVDVVPTECVRVEYAIGQYLLTRDQTAMVGKPQKCTQPNVAVPTPDSVTDKVNAAVGQLQGQITSLQSKLSEQLAEINSLKEKFTALQRQFNAALNSRKASAPAKQAPPAPKKQ